MDDHIEKLRATLVQACGPYLSIDPEISFTSISDDILFEIKVGLKPPTATAPEGVIVRSPRTEMVLTAETLIQLFEEMPDFQHWRHPEIEIGGQVQHHPDGTTELVSEGSLRLFLLVSVNLA